MMLKANKQSFKIQTIYEKVCSSLIGSLMIIYICSLIDKKITEYHISSQLYTTGCDVKNVHV